MGDTITGIDNGTSQAPVLDLVAGPACRECEYSLHGDVKTSAIEGLEHDLGGVLARLGRVKGLERQLAWFAYFEGVPRTGSVSRK